MKARKLFKNKNYKLGRFHLFPLLRKEDYNLSLRERSERERERVIIYYPCSVFCFILLKRYHHWWLEKLGALLLGIIPVCIEHWINWLNQRKIESQKEYYLVTFLFASLRTVVSNILHILVRIDNRVMQCRRLHPFPGSLVSSGYCNSYVIESRCLDCKTRLSNSENQRCNFEIQGRYIYLHGIKSFIILWLVTASNFPLCHKSHW